MPHTETEGTGRRRLHQPDEERFRVIRSEEVSSSTSVWEFDESKLTAHGPGTVPVLPSGEAHFHWAKSGEYITQVSAIGPLGLTYIDPANDPRERTWTPRQ